MSKTDLQEKNLNGNVKLVYTFYKCPYEEEEESRKGKSFPSFDKIDSFNTHGNLVTESNVIEGFSHHTLFFYDIKNKLTQRKAYNIEGLLTDSFIVTYNEKVETKTEQRFSNCYTEKASKEVKVFNSKGDVIEEEIDKKGVV